MKSETTRKTRRIPVTSGKPVVFAVAVAGKK
jgi:hypothetical protein